MRAYVYYRRTDELGLSTVQLRQAARILAPRAARSKLMVEQLGNPLRAVLGCTRFDLCVSSSPLRRAGRMAIAPVLKTGARKGMGVRIPRSPPFPS